MANKNFNNNGFEYVDFELPSGTLWATKNVGADKVTDFGLYFQWGDVQGYSKEQVGMESEQKKFGWSDYKWFNGKKLTKYTTPGATLDLEDDAVRFHMGGDWHIPTPNQIQELIDNTKIEWTAFYGIRGIKFTSTKDTSKYIFIPTAGNAWDGSFANGGKFGAIWSSMLRDYNVDYGKRLFFDSERALLGTSSRNLGLSIRGVIG